MQPVLWKAVHDGMKQTASNSFIASRHLCMKSAPGLHIVFWVPACNLFNPFPNKHS
jgi:hypothetical protein